MAQGIAKGLIQPRDCGAVCRDCCVSVSPPPPTLTVSTRCLPTKRLTCASFASRKKRLQPSPTERRSNYSTSVRPLLFGGDMRRIHCVEQSVFNRPGLRICSVSNVLCHSITHAALFREQKTVVLRWQAAALLSRVLRRLHPLRLPRLALVVRTHAGRRQCPPPTAVHVLHARVVRLMFIRELVHMARTPQITCAGYGG